MTEKTTLPDIRKTAEFNAPIQKVWEAVATQEGLSTWFMPNGFKAEVDHCFEIQTPYGVSNCRVTEVQPPHRLAFLWGEEGWLITFDLQEQDGKTLFTLTHSGWEDKIFSNGMPASAAHARMNGGWDSIVNQALRNAVEGEHGSSTDA